MKNADLALCKFHGVMHDNKMDIWWMVPYHEHCWCVHKQVKGTRFLFSVLWGRWVGNHPQEDLAKFGYRLERTIEILRISNTIWLCIGTDCLNMVISFFFSLSKYGGFGPSFSQKVLCRICIAFFFRQSGKILQKSTKHGKGNYFGKISCKYAKSQKNLRC